MFGRRRKPVVVHYHIFKNAGMSVDAALQNCFGGAWTNFEGAHPADVQSPHALRDFLLQRPEIEAVSTHLGRPPLPWPECAPIVFLRHPALRARSVFEFTRRDPSQPFSAEAGRLGFAGYVRWALEGHGNGIVIRNYQVVHLSAASFRAPHIHEADANDDDLRESCDLLAEWGVAGVVEHFAASLARLQSAYGARVPRLRLEPLWINRTQTMAGDTAQALAAINHALGPALYDRLLQHNALDLKLHDFACRLLARA